VLRSAVWAYLSFLALAAVIRLFVTANWPFLLIGGELAVLATICAVMSRELRPASRLVFTSVIAMHAVLIASIGIVVGPLPLVPVITFGFLPISLMLPGRRYPLTCLVFGLASIAIPFALELAGAVPPSITIVGDAIQLRPWAIPLSPSLVLAMTALMILLQVVAVVFVLDRQRRAQDAAQERVHVLKWHFAQVIPNAPGSTVALR
jgi:eukaryotic-like serine/threonine-protein kinase